MVRYRYCYGTVEYLLVFFSIANLRNICTNTPELKKYFFNVIDADFWMSQLYIFS